MVRMVTFKFSFDLVSLINLRRLALMLKKQMFAGLVLAAGVASVAHAEGRD